MGIRQQDRSLQEVQTTMAPAAVLQAAKDFFARRNNVYAAFIEQESQHHITMRGQGGEEIVVAAHAAGGSTRVTGSTYMFDQQLARFLSGLPTPAAPFQGATPAAGAR